MACGRSPTTSRPTPPPRTTSAAPLDGSRAGFYYVNLYKPEVRPNWEMMALSLHEAVPGHHFQIAPRHGAAGRCRCSAAPRYFTAYGEGWGLYAERLGYDMGLYDDPYDRMGQLAYDMWRAVRLVVDTGMHSQGLEPRPGHRLLHGQRAQDRAGHRQRDRPLHRHAGAGAGLQDRPAQDLRAAERAPRRSWATRFDVREFNDAVLATGSVPLQALETPYRRLDRSRRRRRKAAVGRTPHPSPGRRLGGDVPALSGASAGDLHLSH